MVRYHNSGTQKFDDTEHESVNTERGSINEIQQINIAAGSDVSDSRSTDVIYQNSENHTIMVAVSGQSDGSGGAVDHGIALRIGQKSFMSISDEVWRSVHDGLTEQRIDGGFGIVPPGYYYQVNTVGRSIDSLFYWVERGMRP
jgi:hypothetical protein